MKKLLYLLLFISLPFAVISQNIKGNDLKIKKKSRLIGQVTIGSRSFDNSAILTLTATDRGLLIPRLTTAERDAISSPTAGLMVYNTTDNKFQYYNAGWLDVGVGVADSSFVTLQVDTVKTFNNTNIQFADSVFFQNPVQIDSPFTVNLAQSTFKGIDATNVNFVAKFQDNVGTDLLSVRNDGNVGIGIDNPTAHLHINSTNSFGSQLVVQSSNTSGTGITIQNTSTGGVKWTIISNGSGNLGGGGHLQFFDGVTTPFFFHKDGKLGISQTTGFIPARVLELRVTGNDDGISLSKSGAFHAFLQTSSIGGYLQLRDAGGLTSVVVLNDPSSAHDFINTGATRNFGIGLITPSEKLEVNGNIKCDTVFSDAINIFSVSDTILTAAVLTLNSSPVTIVAVPGAGKIIEVINATFQIIFNTTAYVTNTTLRVITATAQSQQVLESQLLLSTGSRIVRGAISGSGVGTTDTQLVVNQALTIDVATGNPETGDSKFVYYVTYRIITL